MQGEHSNQMRHRRGVRNRNMIFCCDMTSFLFHWNLCSPTFVSFVAFGISIDSGPRTLMSVNLRNARYDIIIDDILHANDYGLTFVQYF